jgi:hypothetical protein
MLRHRIIVEFDENLGKSGGISPEPSGPSGLQSYSHHVPAIPIG